MATEFKEAVYALEDGTVFRGRAFGATATITGEAVFNTSMTGYQEVVTDPSYYAQIVTMTSVQIGNYGVNPDDAESDGPKVAGLVVRELSPVTSSWRSHEDLGGYLARHGVPGISGVDTRAITKRLRVAGTMKACLSTEGISDEEAIARARAWEGLEGVDLVKEVTTKKAYHLENLAAIHSAPFTVEGTDMYRYKRPEKIYKLAAFDFGAKRSILHKLHQNGFDVHVLPADATLADVDALAPDAVFLSNGPGDPSATTYAHATVRQIIKKYPTFGICLGHQILAHAIGAKTFKLKFGHRGGNQPVKNTETDRVLITAQNHGFASSAEDLESCGAIVTEINLNDNTVEGMRHSTYPFFSVQFHPEAGPGPNESNSLFQDFYHMVEKHHAAS